jgi:uncharacterized protein (TIGR03066 family)
MTRFMTPLAALLALTVSVAALAQAQEPKGEEMKLLGKWKLTKSSKGDLPSGLQAVIHFEKDGKVTMKVELADKKQDAAGTWKLDGKKLTVEYTDGPPKGKKETMVVKKLTDEELVTVDEKDVTEEFKRVKDDK